MKEVVQNPDLRKHPWADPISTAKSDRMRVKKSAILSLAKLCEVFHGNNRITTYFFTERDAKCASEITDTSSL